ncbi:baseplate protein, partial [Salmonella enterica subsp. enterica serovar Typhimurium]
LIDCSASPAQHNGENILLLASALARTFGVDVVDAGAPAAAVNEAQPEHGETVVDCQNRLLGQAQALA